VLDRDGTGLGKAMASTVLVGRPCRVAGWAWWWSLVLVRSWWCQVALCPRTLLALVALGESRVRVVAVGGGAGSASASASACDVPVLCVQ